MFLFAILLLWTCKRFVWKFSCHSECVSVCFEESMLRFSIEWKNSSLIMLFNCRTNMISELPSSFFFQRRIRSQSLVIVVVVVVFEFVYFVLMISCKHPTLELLFIWSRSSHIRTFCQWLSTLIKQLFYNDCIILT